MGEPVCIALIAPSSLREKIKAEATETGTPFTSSMLGRVPIYYDPDMPGTAFDVYYDVVSLRDRLADIRKRDNPNG